MVRSIADLLNTNAVPTLEESTVIGQALAEPNRRAQNLTYEITGLRLTLDQLLQEKDVLTSHIDAHKALLSPMRHLPPDILQEIFCHCLPVGRNPVMSSREAPVLLTRICSLWRGISLSTPQLWAAIHIAIPVGNPFNVNKVCHNAIRREAITAWLSRSGVCPLSISLFSPCFIVPDQQYETCQSFLDVLLPSVLRWRSIRLTLPHFQWEGLFDRIRTHDVPLLEEIYLEGLTGDCEPSSPCFTAAMESGLFKAPRLRSVWLARFHPSVLRLPINWSNLTHLDLSDSNWPLSDKMRVLSQCPQLKYVRIRLPNRLSLNSPEQPLVTLPNLVGLSIIDSSRLDSITLFRHLSTPELRHFGYERISGRSRPSVLPPSGRAREDFRSRLATFFNKALHPIEELELCAQSLSDYDVMGFLYLLPSLKRLSLTSPDRTSSNHHSGIVSDNYFTFGTKELWKLTPASTEASYGGGNGDAIDCDSTNDHEEEESDCDSTNDHEEEESVMQIPTQTHPGRVGISEPRETVVMSPEIPLCPKLEVFHCRGAVFSHSAMLRFLRSRSAPNPALGIARLREAYIQFGSGRTESKSSARKLVRLKKETGMFVDVTYALAEPNPIYSSYSPYDGLLSDGMLSDIGGQRYFGF